jgi:flagellar basal body rod protein FlgG
METGISMSIAGITAFGRQLETIASNTANVNTDGYKAKKATIVENNQGVPELTVTINKTAGIPIQGPDTPVRESSNVDLSQEMPNMLIARRGYEANLKALKVQDELNKSVLDILA